MASLLNRSAVFLAALTLSACASSSVPKSFVYDTSLRGQQSWMGASARLKASDALLAQGVVTDPQVTLETALPEAEVKLGEWGLRYFDSDWTRYAAVLAVDVTRGDEATKCRLSDPETVADAPLLKELTANGGADLQARLDRLVALCVEDVLNPASP